MQYDVTVIGSGPGGYVAAIRCAQLGMKTAIIEKYNTLGGTCLNVGCIPSKALLDSSEHYYQAKQHFAVHGIITQGLSVDFTKMIQRKNDVVKQTCDGINFLMKKNKIDVYQGHGSFIDKNTIQITKSDHTALNITTKNTIIATGSKPSSLPNVVIDKKKIITSTEALSLKEIPKAMIVIGGGVIGVELGSVYARLGTKVTIIEYMDTIIPNMDNALSKELLRTLKKIGIEFYLGHGVTQASIKGDSVTVTFKENKTEKIVELNVDYCLVAVGRKPYTENLGLDKVAIGTDNKGCIIVNDKLETNVSGIFAIGDVIQGPMLAHKAEEEGIFVAETLSGQKPHVNYHAIPSVVYTWPEVAGVGYTEEELKKEQKEYKSGTFQFRALGRARAANEIDGFIKVLADKKTDEILGVQMIGPRVSDMIAEAVLALEYRASAEDIALTCHAHPTFTEAFKEACLAATANRSIHS